MYRAEKTVHRVKVFFAGGTPLRKFLAMPLPLIIISMRVSEKQ